MERTVEDTDTLPSKSWNNPPTLFDIWVRHGTSLDQKVFDPRKAIALVHKEVFDPPVLGIPIDTNPLVQLP